MIKTILTLIAKVLESRLKKSGLEEVIFKNKNYITEAKKIWNMIDENSRISKTIEEKLSSKADEFDKILLVKFPELTQDDIAELRQSIAGEVNAGKEVVLSQVDVLKQLQDSNTQLQAENASLENQLSQVQAAVATTAQVTTDSGQTGVDAAQSAATNINTVTQS